MSGYAVLADTILLLHLLFVIFVVMGLLVVLLGRGRWSWVRNGWFRLAHLTAIAVVAAQAWLGRICPLTILEMWLRRQAGQTTYQGSFIQHWVSEVLYYSAPPWVFVILYTGFGMLVAAAWFLVPPSLPWTQRDGD